MSLKKTNEAALPFLKDSNHKLFFFDEGRFGTKPVLGRMYGRVGRRLIRRVCPGYKNFYIYSAVSPVDGESFHLSLPWVNTEMMSLYLGELSKACADCEAWVIMDKAGWHLSKDLIVPKNIRLIYLPSYSPELNPVERLWQYLRRRVCRNRLFETLEELEQALCRELREIAREAILSLCGCNYLTYVN